MAKRAVIIGLCVCLLTLPVRAGSERADGPIDAGFPRAGDQIARGNGGTAPEPICLLIEAAARAHALPAEFFARVIWQESRFRAGAVGPVTRSGDRALGIAQFMPRTAAERGLLDPFDPIQALPKSAEFLRELWLEFGNLGLAAAAYNGGPQRVRDFLTGSGFMPSETRNYVVAITGASIEEWVEKGRELGVASRSVPVCQNLMARSDQGPNPFVQALEARVSRAAQLPWGVQLASGFSRTKALDTYSTIVRRYQNLLEQSDPIILNTRLRSRGTRPFYQVRVGVDRRANAEALCSRLRRAGAACMVLRNETTFNRARS